MSRDPSADGIRTAGELEAALGTLLATAVRNDVDLRGGWVCETDSRRDDWEVMVHELG